MRSLPLSKKLIFATIPVILLFFGLEFGLRLVGFQGTSIQDIKLSAGFQQNAYVQRRDRILGNWFIADKDVFYSNPYLIDRGFHQQQFAKISNKRRFFVLGGSTTYGSPFEHQAKGFPQRMEEWLNAKQNAEWEIINWGVAGMDSVSFPAIIRELQDYHAEGIVIYAGNNETRGTLIEMCSSPKREALATFLHRFRSYQLLEDQYRRFNGVTVQFDAMAEKQDDCMRRAIQEQQQQPKSLQTKVVTRFQKNLNETISLATQQNLKIFVAIPPINWEEPPVYREPTADKPLVFSKIQQLLRQKSTDWKQILSLDPDFAWANYNYAMQLQQKGKTEEALTFFQKALEQDLLSQRITLSLQKMLYDICDSNTAIYCVDIATVFDQEQQKGTPLSELFFDFCHPTYQKGTFLIAETISQKLLTVD